MRIPAILTAVLVLLAPVGAAHAVGESDLFRDDGSLRFRFYVEGEVLGIERGDTSSVNVSFIGTDAVIETDDVVADDFDLGGRALVGYRLDEKQAVEAAFLGWGHEDDTSVNSPGQFLNAFEFPDAAFDNTFDDAEDQKLDFESSLYSGEINYRRDIAVDGADYRFRLLAGIRALRLEDDLDFRSLDDVPSALPSDLGTYDVATRNTLIGGQVGVEAIVPFWEDRLDLNLYAVAGGYANQTKTYVDFFDGGDGAPANSIRRSHDEWNGAGVFEGSAHLKIKLFRGVRMMVGYRAVYLVGVAVAEDQFAKSGSPSDFTPGFENDANLLFHGPSVGLGVDF